MISFMTVGQAQDRIRRQVRYWRLRDGLTQAGLAARSGVNLATLRKFERDGTISLTSYLKLLWAQGGLEKMVRVRERSPQGARGANRADNSQRRRRGRRT